MISGKLRFMWISLIFLYVIAFLQFTVILQSENISGGSFAKLFKVVNISDYANRHLSERLERVKHSKEKEMVYRNEHQLLKCKETDNTRDGTSEPILRHHLQPNFQHKFMYCGIEKAGSTFWRRFLQCINKRVVQSPYQIKPEKVSEDYKDIKNTKFIPLLRMLQSFTKFTFVRNPFSRLFSGYVDKIYSPNPYYWWRLGAAAVKLSRRQRYPCGHDTTFKEFVDYIIYSQRKKNRDEHFIPAHDLCMPCHIHYDFIGKMETFSSDTFYILEKLNLSEYLPVLRDFKNQSVTDTIYDVSQAFVKFRKQASTCLDYDHSLKRVWRKLQIRGIIADEVRYPFRASISKDIQTLDLFNSLQRAHEKSLEYNLTEQKQKYLINAYNMIPLKTMFKLVDVYELDFNVFNYERYPAHLFKNRTMANFYDIFSISNI